MQPIKHVTFGRFRFDATNEQLWDGSRVISLRPKAFAVLAHLVGRPGQLVTKQQLLDAVWPGTFVSDAVLKDSVRQLREALGDDAASPRYIETAHRRGYRFISELSERSGQEGPQPKPSAGAGSAATTQPVDARRPPPAPARRMLGRDADLARMDGWIDRALQGERQVVFVTGEVGIGKTTLVAAALEHAAERQGFVVASGQCLEHYGVGEAYLPVLDALARLGRGPGGARVVDVLREHAPAWLLELPSLVPVASREALRQEVAGTSRERMLREMAHALEALTLETPLILLLEDLHWSDYSTLDLVAYLARRHDPARLMVVGTYRPVEVILGDHPLKGVKRELQAHGRCHELPLEYLTEEAIAQYLSARCPDHQLPVKLARLLQRRTEGNPLFMTTLVEYLIEERVIIDQRGHWRLQGGLGDVETRVPENIRQLIEKQIERLTPDERKVLEGASVVGRECSSVAIAAGLSEPATWVDEHCEALVRRHQFLLPARVVELPDGTVTARYEFRHVLHLEVPYNLLPSLRRSQIHRRIGDVGERIYGERVGEIAAELAMHFEQGQDPARAVKYLALAAETAAHRSAHHEAEALARRALQALDTQPETPERDRHELGLRILLGISLMALKGFAAAEVEQMYRRALELCARHGAAAEAFRGQWLLGLFHYFRGELQSAHDTAASLLALSAGIAEPTHVIEGHRACGVTLVDLGRFAEALEHFDKVSTLYASARSGPGVTFAGQDPLVVGESFAARALWALGYPDGALQRARRGVALATALSHAESLVIAHYFATHVHQLRGEVAAVRTSAETVIALAGKYELQVWLAFGLIHHGWARAEQAETEEGIDEIRRGLATYEATGAKLWRAHFLGLLALALARGGRATEGMAAVTEALALVRGTGENYCLAELNRLAGELLLLNGGSLTDAEEWFKQSLAVAREQRARSLELRAATSLGRLRQLQGRHDEAGRLVRDTLASFEEGFDTVDLRAAAALVSGRSRNPRAPRQRSADSAR